MTNYEYSIKDLANIAQSNVRTIRGYIEKGLLPSANRRGPGAAYSETHLQRLLLIRQLLEQWSLSLADIRSLLMAMDDVTVARIVAIEPEKVAALATLERGSILGLLRGPAAALESLSRPDWREWVEGLESPDVNEAIAPPVDSVAFSPRLDSPADASGFAASTRRDSALDYLSRVGVAATSAGADRIPPQHPRRGRRRPGGRRPESGTGADPATHTQTGAPPLETLLHQLERLGGERTFSRQSRTERWHRIEVTPDLEIHARHMTKEQLKTLRRISDHIRHYLTGGR